MQYIAFVMRLIVMLIGLTLIYRSWGPMEYSSECLTGLAIFLT